MKYIVGDLLRELEEGRVDAMAHVCNDLKVMGAGIALQVKNQIPTAFRAYKDQLESYRETEIPALYDPIGLVSYADGVYNIVGQRGYGKGNRHLDYEGLYNGLETVKTMMKTGKLGIPYLMGAARAGGDWRIVEKMIEVVFEHSDIEVTIVEYELGNI